MKTIGMLGGMSWESTISYYRMLNEGVKTKLGQLHSAKIILFSVDFEEIARLQKTSDWESAGRILGLEAEKIEAGGADMLLICTNTMHKVNDLITKNLSIPTVHIIDETARVLLEKNVEKVGLLGTRYTMHDGFYHSHMLDKHGIKTLVPSDNVQLEINRIIFEEICLGKIKEESREYYLQVIQSLHQEGAQGIILGCTEIALLIQQKHTDIQLFDSTKIHVDAALFKALSLVS